MTDGARRFAGHLRTVGRLTGDLLRPPVAPPAERWRGALDDPITGRVPVIGWLSRAAGARDLVVLVHGLGGSAESHYLRRAAAVAHALGLDSLRLNLRGADPAAGDFYHGGLTAELDAVVADPALAGYERIAVLGYSMGGHVALRWAAAVDDARVAAVAAVCSPLHLRPVSDDYERPSRAPYRCYVLRRLRRAFAELERAGARLPRPRRELRRARTFRRWDALTVVPRFGFADADDYYERASAAVTLDRLRVRCLLLASEVDPMVTPRAITPYLPAGAAVHSLTGSGPRPPLPASPPPGSLAVAWHRGGGHVVFPRTTDLGVEAPPGIEAQLLGWLVASGRRAAGRTS